MPTYTFTLTGTFEADTVAEATADYEEWLCMRGVSEGAVVSTDEGDRFIPTADAVWASLSPAAKASWVSAMQPLPPTTERNA